MVDAVLLIAEIEIEGEQSDGDGDAETGDGAHRDEQAVRHGAQLVCRVTNPSHQLGFLGHFYTALKSLPN